MLKLSVITDEVSQDLGEVMAFARRNGMTGLEPRSVNGHGPFEWDEADIAAIDAARAALGHASGCRITDRYSFEATADEAVRLASPAVEALG